MPNQWGDEPISPSPVINEWGDSPVAVAETPYTAIIREAEDFKRRSEVIPGESALSMMRRATPELVTEIERQAREERRYHPSKLFTTTLRVAPPLLAAPLTGGISLPAALGITGLAAGGGEMMAEATEGEGLSVPRIAASTILGAAPGAPLGRIANPLARGAIRVGEGAALGASAPLIERGLQGELPTLQEVGTGAALGALIGLPFGGIETLRRMPVPTPPKSAQILADPMTKPPALANVATEIATQTKGSPYALQQKLNQMTGGSPATTAVPREQRQAELEHAFGFVKPNIESPKTAAESAEVFMREAAEPRAIQQMRSEAVAAETAAMERAATSDPPVELAAMAHAAETADAERIALSMMGATPDEAAILRRGIAVAHGLPVEYQYTIQRPQKVDNREIPGYIQIDEIIGGQNIGSSGIEKMHAEGISLPDVPDWVPQGRYTLQEIQKLIKGGRRAIQIKEPTKGVLRAETPEPELDVGLPPVGKGDAAVQEAARNRLRQEAVSEPLSEADFLRQEAPISPVTPGRSTAATRAAALRRQQRGAASPKALAPLAGGSSGAVLGYASTTRLPNETDEEYAERRLRAAIAGASIGTAGGIALPAAYRNITNRAVSKASALKALQSESVGRESMPEWYLRFRATPAMTSIREAISNNRTRVKDLVSSVSKMAPIPEDTNTYLAGKLFPGVVSEKVRQAEESLRGIEDGIISTAEKSGIPPDVFIARFNEWLEARHTPYYNARLREISAADEAGNPIQHRLSDDQAKAILEKANTDGLGTVFNDLAKGYEGVIDGTRDLLVKSGIINQTLADSWRAMYPHYVPFNRVLPGDASDLAVEKFLGGGPGMNVLGTGVHRITGSDLPVADIGGSIYANFLDAIRRSEKNKVDQTALNFFRKFPDALPGTRIFMPKFGDVIDPTRQLSLRENGNRIVMEFKDPKLATAFSNLNSEQATGILRLISYPTRWFSQLVTRFSPNFLAANPIKDRQEAALKLASQGDWSGAVKTMNPVTVHYADPKTAVDWFRGIDNPDAHLFQQMLDDGGMAGGYASMTRKKAQDAIAEFRKSDVNPIIGAKDKFIKFVDFITDVSEGSTRYRVYKRALELGATRKEAALAARNSSVDFNQKGTITPQASALWAFFNPAIQGPVNSTKAIIRNPETIAAISFAFIGIGSAIDAWNRSYDPDWKNKISFRFARTSGMPVIYGKDEKTGEFLTFNFPVAHGLRPIKAVMDMILDAATGSIDRGNAPDELARVGSAIVDSTNPLGSGSWKTAAFPTISRAALEVLMNEKFSGTPVVPAWMEADPLLSDHVKRYLNSYDTNTGRMANEFSDYLYENMDIDVSPERMRYLIRQYSGGPGRAIADIVNSSPAAMKALQKSPDFEAVRASEVPVASAFFRRINPEVSERESPEFRETQKYVRGIKTEEESRRQQARLFYRNYVDKIPAQNRIGYIQAADQSGLIPQDHIYRRSLMNLLKDGLRGRTETDQLIASLGVESGERARYYIERLRGISTSEERQVFIQKQIESQLMTPDVMRQIQALASEAQ